MATLVLGAVGGIFGGPLGAVAGAVIGGVIDGRRRGGGREGPRLADLAVQGSSHGEPLPRVYGRMRVAGQVIWSTGLIESVHSSGGGKRSGGRTTTYSYSASFAVAVSARPIRAVHRIWADGKLLRTSGGDFVLPGGVLRVHNGGEGQAVDPLIASAEGSEITPAYRGIAYAVFEGLPLADFANRVPNLSFEVEADDGAVTVGAVTADLFAAAGLDAPDVAEAVAEVDGFAVGRAASLRAVMETLALIAPLPVRDGEAGLVIGAAGSDAGTLAADDLGAETGPGVRQAFRVRRGGRASVPETVSVAFADAARDFQTGLQQARTARGGGGRREVVDLPVNLEAGAAKRVAERLLGEAGAARATAEVTLPWRHLAVQPGDRVTHDGALWRVRDWTMEAMGVALSLEAIGADAGVVPAGDPGRIVAQADVPPGDTTLLVIDLPELAGEMRGGPRLWLAAAGASAGWRLADLQTSSDAGATWTSAGVAGPGAVIGQTLDALQDGPADRWDEVASVEVELLADAMGLEGRSAASVLAGANLAVIGGELVQFRQAVATGARRWRLSGLLRGRRGSETATGGHSAGEMFALLLPGTLVPVDVPLGAVGAELLFRAVGPADMAGVVSVQAVTVAGRSLRPLSPVHLRALREASGDVLIRWTRRSRTGFDWIDGADAPLGEEREAYRLSVATIGGARVAEVAVPEWRYPAADQTADGAGASLTVTVAQISAATGAGAAVTRTLAVPVI